MPEQLPPLEAGLLFDEAACGLLLTDAGGTLIEVNRTFSRWLGREGAPLAGTARFQDHLTMGARIFHQTHWLPLMQLQGSISEVKMDFRHADGSRVPMIVNARTHRLQDGRTLHSIATFVARDRDRYEQELLRARAAAVELLRERTALQEESIDRGRFAEQLIGIVSHDLRNPLTAIRMGVDMLQLDQAAERRLELTRRITRAVDRAQRLVSDLLDFALTRTGRPLSIHLAPIHVHEVVAAGVEELRLAFPNASIVHHQVGDPVAQADPARLVQVLGNLVGNAERYGDRTRPITVTTTVDEAFASLYVHNCGTPITAELLPTLFLAMTRGDQSQGAGAGVGLGLYIVNEIAKGLGGEATALSTAEEGTSVGIRFPRWPAEGGSDGTEVRPFPFDGSGTPR